MIETVQTVGRDGASAALAFGHRTGPLAETGPRGPNLRIPGPHPASKRYPRVVEPVSLRRCRRR